MCRAENRLTYSCTILFTISLLFLLNTKRANVLQEKHEDIVTTNENQLN